MSAETHRQTFDKAMRNAAAHNRTLGPATIARLAVKAGMNVQETLREIRLPYDYRFKQEIELADALAFFVSSLCKQSNATCILEYASFNSLLTARLDEIDEKQQI